MGKKIFDISFPKSFSREKTFFSKKEVTESLTLRKESKTKKGFFWGLILLILILAGIFLYFTLSRAEIEIWPETELVTFKTKLKVEPKSENINLSLGLIPGVSFQEERVFSQEFLATGKKFVEKRAEGIIRVFNDSKIDQVLVAQTRFQAPLEKFQPPLEKEKGENPWFRTVERIVIPAKGYKDVKVVADAPGEKYNIGPSTFSVPGLAGTAQYTLVYGKSFEPMKGGFKKEIREVAQEDLKNAEEFLKEKATKEIKEVLKQKIPAEFTTIEEAINIEILETSSLVQVGAEVERFISQLKIKAKTLAFKNKDLENFSLEIIRSNISPDKEIDPKSLKTEYLLETFDLKKEEIVLSLNLGAKIYSKIDELSLKKALSGKSLEESQFFLQHQVWIKQAKVKLWPFLGKKIPENLEKIKIKLNLDY